MKKDSGGLISNLVSKLFDINHCLTTSCYDYLKTSLNTVKLPHKPDAKIIITNFCFYLATYVAFCYSMYALRLLFRDRMCKSQHFDSTANRILLVIAHPDDECMFFGPLILRLTQREKNLYVLCLCNGPADGKGQMRKRELWASCRMLGVKPENIFLINSSFRVERGPKWRSDDIATLVNDYVELLGVDTLISFDKYGVTGDDNHISVFKALSYLNLRKQLPADCHVFLLDSLGSLRKYASVVDVFVSMFSSENVFILSTSECHRVNRAMKLYKTQIRWYWRLYIMVSRYTHVNSFSELPRYKDCRARLFSFDRLL